MQKQGDAWAFSARDLVHFTSCRHRITLDMAQAEAERAGAERARAERAEAPAAEPGAKAVADGLPGIRVGQLAGGAPVIGGETLIRGAWSAQTDLLERCDRPSALGDFSYEVVERLPQRLSDPAELLRLVLASELLAEVQGVMPEQAHVGLPDGHRQSFALGEYAAYARRVRTRLEDFVAQRPATRPRRCAACGDCDLQARCRADWAAGDSLYNVATITERQVTRLEAAGVATMAALAECDAPVRAMSPATQARLVAQARLQQARKSGAPAYQLRPALPGKGFDLLPAPRAGDVFYQQEGAAQDRGGEGLTHVLRMAAQSERLRGDDPAGVMGWLRDRLAPASDARIYHFGPEPVTTLKRLTQAYGCGEAFLDRLLREGRFVDLQAVLRGGLIVSEPGYDLETLAVFWGGGPEAEADGHLTALRDWLLRVAPARGRPEATAAHEPQEAAEKEAEAEQAVAELRAMLAASGLPEARQQLLFDLAQYHAREAKPAWWAIHESLGRETEALIDATEALGGLVPVGPAEQVKRSVQRRYRFPAQETRLRSGISAVVAPRMGGGFDSLTITALDPRAREVTLKVGAARAALLDSVTALHPPAPLDTGKIAEALREAIADQCGPRQFRAVEDLLSRLPPRFHGGPRADVLQGQEPVAGTVSAVLDMDETVLPVQGPPGTGKTYVTARAILALLRAGRRVAVSSTSHEAIRNVLTGVARAAGAAGADCPAMVHRLGEDGYPAGSPVHRALSNSDPVLETAQLVGGTVFYFARPENRQAFDHIFVDEAGQVGLANMVVLATAARNVVMVGDPRQLPQVVQGSHPPPVDLSCLEWMQGEAGAIPPDRGIFLPVSRRMHPAICSFLSERVYGGALTAHEATARQSVAGVPGLPGQGVHLLPVDHTGNTQSAPEEVEAIRDMAQSLLAGRWTGQDGRARPLTEADIIVVAPYNLQVNALRRALPAGIRVGTVDRFQGQEAPVCLVSMTGSSASDLPRGLDFLLSLNRINVALSRAKGLALVFAAPRLLDAGVATIEEMALVNTLCALAEQGADLREGPEIRGQR